MLQGLGYEVIRQKGSHVRLRHEGPPVHTVTVPLHHPLKTGTLHGILAEVALMRSTTVDALAELL
jgi:predicted RNA binding protein YcfA (HicA-like mRNA interferase family)